MNAKQRLLMQADKVKQQAMLLKLGQDLRCSYWFNGVWEKCCFNHDVICALTKLEDSPIEWKKLRLDGDKGLRQCVRCDIDQSPKIHKRFKYNIFLTELYSEYMSNAMFAFVRGYSKIQYKLKFK